MVNGGGWQSTIMTRASNSLRFAYLFTSYLFFLGPYILVVQRLIKLEDWQLFLIFPFSCNISNWNLSVSPSTF